MNEQPLVTYERRDRVAYIGLNRPGALNAITFEMDVAIDEVLTEFDLDDEAWVAVLFGHGPSFCAGADVKQRFQGASAKERTVRQGRGVAGHWATLGSRLTGNQSSPQSTVIVREQA